MLLCLFGLFLEHLGGQSHFPARRRGSAGFVRGADGDPGRSRGSKGWQGVDGDPDQGGCLSWRSLSFGAAFVFATEPLVAQRIIKFMVVFYPDTPPYLAPGVSGAIFWY